LVSQQFGEVKSGIGVYTRNVARKLLADGHHVTLICPRERASTHIRDLQLELVSGKGAGSSHVRWMTLSRRFGLELKALRRRQRFDLVHFTDAREALFCALKDIPSLGNMNDYYFAAAPRTPWAFKQDYVDWPVRWAYYSTVRFLERRALPKLTVIICNSQHTQKALAEAYNLPRENLQVIYKSIDVAGYTFQPRRPDDGDPYVLFIGGNVQRKGLPTLIRAAPAILGLIPRTRFAVVGDNQNLSAMKALCSKYGVENSFHFLGWQSQNQIQEHYHRASVFVMPSLIEAFGVVFLEAMASGVPVIGGAVGGTRELIKEGVNGLLVPPRDHRFLAERILSLLQNEEFRQQLIRNGRETVKRYGVEEMLQETYQLYERILTEGLGPKLC
jgi:glycosyltransferase involved in cell wall biosynthesis